MPYVDAYGISLYIEAWLMTIYDLYNMPHDNNDVLLFLFKGLISLEFSLESLCNLIAILPENYLCH